MNSVLLLQATKKHYPPVGDMSYHSSSRYLCTVVSTSEGKAGKSRIQHDVQNTDSYKELSCKLADPAAVPIHWVAPECRAAGQSHFGTQTVPVGCHGHVGCTNPSSWIRSNSHPGRARWRDAGLSLHSFWDHQPLSESRWTGDPRRSETLLWRPWLSPEWSEVVCQSTYTVYYSSTAAPLVNGEVSAKARHPRHRNACGAVTIL